MHSPSQRHSRLIGWHKPVGWTLEWRYCSSRMQMEVLMDLSRRLLLALGTTALLGGATGAPFAAWGQQAQFTYKCASNLPETHPMNARAREMAAVIRQE